MSTFSYDFARPFTAKSTPLHSLLPPAAAPLAVAFLTFVSTAWCNPLYTLSTSAISWTIIYGICARIMPRSGRFGSGDRPRGRAAVLAACILGSALCDRATGASTSMAWAKAFLPLVYVCLRLQAVGGPWSTEWAITNRRWALALITITGCFVTAPVTIDKSSLILGFCGTVFSALTYILLEDNFWVPTENNGPLHSGLDNLWLSWLAFGKYLALYLGVGFFVFAVLFENIGGEFFHFQSAGWEAAALRPSWTWSGLLHMTGVAGIGAVRWMMVPMLVSQSTVLTLGFADLSTAVLISLAASFSGISFLASFLAVATMMWWGTSLTQMAAGMAASGSGGPQQMPLRWMHLLVLTAMCATFAGLYVIFGGHSESMATYVRQDPVPIVGKIRDHPIPRLVEEANKKYDSMLAGQSKDLSQAVKEYQRRYGIHPPPNFDRWYEFAKERNVLLIDEYDMIFDMIRPLWGQPPAEIRKRVRETMGFADDFMLRSNNLVHAYIRAGNVRTGGQGDDWQKDATAAMMKDFVTFLPDMDLAFNIHDEPRVVLGHDMLNQYVRKADETFANITEEHRKDPSRGPSNTFTALSADEAAIPPRYPFTTFNVFAHQGTWSHATTSCPADSPVRSIDSSAKDDTSKYLLEPFGFIKNSTASSDICLQPSLENRFGFFDRPNAFSVTQHQIPIFSQSKISSFGDILYPSPWYWANKVPYNALADKPWDKKATKLYWRGTSTGGFSRNGSWKKQHRQRLISIMEKLDNDMILQRTTPESDWEAVKVQPATFRDLFDAHFTGIGQCDPEDCDQQREYFDLKPPAKQQDAWKYKFLLDMDGNAFSGRYHAFLRSNSAVFKSAIFREWHDEWLLPWVHYIPLSLEGAEIVEVVRFFTYEKEGQEMAKKIAEEGKRWAERMLHNGALETWFFRLLLEYGRVIDDNRDKIGYFKAK